jgi:peptidoglycan/xylan/chitin deacetylase (PgdA/CDA1 family)
MRIDRLVSLAVSAIPSPGKRHRIAILMYHSISDRAEDHKPAYYKMVTSPARFAQQMQWLARKGIEVVGLEAWNSPYHEGNTQRVIITFDDGFADFMTNAFPLLHAYGYPATMFLPTDFIETGRTHLAGVEQLRWSEIRQLQSAGIRFGSHTASHRHLETLSRFDIQEEIRKSTAVIQEHIDEKVTSFSCPYAFPQAYPAVVSAIHESLEENGFTVGVTTKIGTASIHDDPYTLNRLPINSDDDEELFMAKLNGGYNWLNGVQYIVQKVKKTLH